MVRTILVEAAQQDLKRLLDKLPLGETVTFVGSVARRKRSWFRSKPLPRNASQQPIGTHAGTRSPKRSARHGRATRVRWKY